MAEFCMQCARKFGFREDDFVGLTTAEDWVAGRAAVALCEECGPTLVDPEGRCVTDCRLHHAAQGPASEAEQIRTWGSFKKAVEAKGVKDSQEVVYIDWSDESWVPLQVHVYPDGSFNVTGGNYVEEKKAEQTSSAGDS